MSQSEIRNIYDSLVVSGDLSSLFPTLTGDWSLDRIEFSSQYNLTERLLENLDGDLDDEDFDIYEEY